MKTAIALLIVVGCIFLFNSNSAIAKGGHGYGNGSSAEKEYAWTPKTAEERASEYLRRPDSFYGNAALVATNLKDEVDEIKSISPDLKEKLLKHASAMLELLKKSEDSFEIKRLSEVLVFYQKKIGFNKSVVVNAVARERSVNMGQKAIVNLAANCKEAKECAKNKEGCTNMGELEMKRRGILRDISDTLDAGVTLEEIGVESMESMRDRAECRQ